MKHTEVLSHLKQLHARHAAAAVHYANAISELESTPNGATIVAAKPTEDELARKRSAAMKRAWAKRKAKAKAAAEVDAQVAA